MSAKSQQRSIRFLCLFVIFGSPLLMGNGFRLSPEAGEVYYRFPFSAAWKHLEEEVEVPDQTQVYLSDEASAHLIFLPERGQLRITGPTVVRTSRELLVNYKSFSSESFFASSKGQSDGGDQADGILDEGKGAEDKLAFLREEWEKFIAYLMGDQFSIANIVKLVRGDHSIDLSSRESGDGVIISINTTDYPISFSFEGNRLWQDGDFAVLVNRLDDGSEIINETTDNLDLYRFSIDGPGTFRILLQDTAVPERLHRITIFVTDHEERTVALPKLRSLGEENGQISDLSPADELDLLVHSDSREADVKLSWTLRGRAMGTHFEVDLFRDGENSLRTFQSEVPSLFLELPVGTYWWRVRLADRQKGSRILASPVNTFNVLEASPANLEPILRRRIQELLDDGQAQPLQLQ